MATPSLVGDSTAEGDTVATGASTVTFEGKAVARIGDTTVKGETITGPGVPSVTIEGKVIAVIGDVTTESILKRKGDFWGPGPITGPGAPSVSV